MTTRTQLDAIIAEHLDPTTKEQFEAAERMVQAAYNLSLERIAELERYINNEALPYVARAGNRLEEEKAKVAEQAQRIKTLEAEHRRLDGIVFDRTE